MNYAKEYLKEKEKDKKNMIKVAKKQIERNKALQERVQKQKEQKPQGYSQEDYSIEPID